MPELHDPARAPTLSSVPSSVKPAPLTRAERVRRFGVDIPADRLEWKAGWQPGGEYTKQLVVKNVSTRVMKIKYRLPESKYFSMAFPETIKLTPGLAKVLEVHFRPIRLEEYDDVVEFLTEKGSFVVPIGAAIPQISSHVPTNLDFGFCPIAETGVKTFVVTNDGEVPIDFSWTFEEPFTLTPASGSIAVGATQTITARFAPTDGCVYVATCVCTVPGHTSHSMKLGGIGKFPFVEASAEKLDFGRMLVGTGGARHFKLCNKSLVFARFKIVRREDDCEVRSPAPLAPPRPRRPCRRANAPAARRRPLALPLTSSPPLHPCRRCSRRLPPPASSPPTASKPSPSTTNRKWRGPSPRNTTTSSRPAATRS